MKKVVLVNPLIIQYSPKPYPPHNLLYLAAALVGRQDVSVEIVDYNVGDHVERFLRDSDVLFFGLGTQSGSQLRSAEAISRRIRNQANGVPIVWGGIHPTLAPAETIKEDYVDVVVRGEGELALNQLVDAYLRGQELEHVKGLMYKEPRSGKGLSRITDTGSADPVDLDNLQPLPFGLLDLAQYHTDILWGITSRSCPYRCNFCVAAALEERWHAMSPEKIVEYVSHGIEQLRPNGVYFMDYNFFFDESRVRRMAELFLEQDIELPWIAQITGSSASKLLPDTMEILRRSGCVTLVTGQDGAKTLMRKVRKPSTYEQILTAERRLDDHGIALARNFIVGHPGETRNDLLAVVRDIADNEREFDTWLNIYIFTLFPGTPITSQLRVGEHASLVPTTTRQWADVIFSDAARLGFHPAWYRDMVRTVFYVVRARYNQLPLPYDSGARGWHERLILFVLLLVARLRWRTKFFGLGYEWGWFDRWVSAKYRRFYGRCESEAPQVKPPPPPRDADVGTLRIGWSGLHAISRLRSSHSVE
jgi:radical SAM superfamily enzyme YgiQ (UPF0313 family)